VFSTEKRPTGFIYSSEYLNHRTGLGHPESPDRLKTIVRSLSNSPIWSSLYEVIPKPASEENINLVHHQDYIQYVAQTCSLGDSILDGGDTVVCRDSYSVALLAAGGVIEGIRLIFKGAINNAFCAVRPPGHHAESNVAMGFCLFNNAAIAARFAQSMYNINRILILDWDVHHGNGTQHIFESDSSVLYVSIHQYPFYPGTGSQLETGKGDGLGKTKNYPLHAGSGDKDYLNIFEDSIPEIIMKFSPELIILSSGFDAHIRDPLASMRVSTDVFKRMTEIIVRLAEDLCGGRLLSILEGGYDLQALQECTQVHMNVLVHGVS